MKIEFWGAARTVTGSMHLVETAGRRILLDCGMYHGRREEAFERNRDLPFDAGSIDAVLLSHAHIDHSGNLPTLVRSGYRGEVLCTSATRDLAAHLLLDSARIQESDVRRVNRLRLAEGRHPFEPLYTETDVAETLDRFVAVPYDRPRELFPGLTARFIDAGHMLGSASVVLEARTSGGTRRLLFSGDIGREGLPILRDPRTVGDVDWVIMESTYGDRRHEDRSDARARLLEIVERCHAGGGKLLVPSFAVGRAQELAYRLNGLFEEGRLPPIEVYIDTPLGVKITEVYRLHPECYDREMARRLEEEADRDPLGFERLTWIRDSNASRRLNDLEGAAVIIAPSGMCEGGRILHHILHHGGDPATTILFVGFQAPGTLGRRILDGERRVRIFGEPFTLEAAVRSSGAYSAHADRDELIDWIERVRGPRGPGMGEAAAAPDAGRPSRVFLVHGEPEAAGSLATELERRGFTGVSVPARGNVVELD